MDRQTITVDIAPEGYADHRLKVSQYDVGRPLGVYIKQNGADLDCSNYTAQLYLYKPDRTNIEKACSIAGNLITWDTAEQETIVAGICVAEIRIREGSRNIGTANFSIWVEESPADTSGSSHSESQSLIDMVDRAEDAAETAESSAAIAVHAKDDAEAAARQAVEAIESYDEMTAAATGLSAGSNPTAEIDRTGDNPILRLGIPAGNAGYSPTVTITTITGGHRITITDATGDYSADVLDGVDGDDGYSPTVSITTITGGHRITITDKTGDHSADVMDGEDGDDGYSPTVTVTEITGGHRVTITDQQGQHPFDVMDGEDSAVLSVNGKTGTVVLDGNDINIDNSNQTPESIADGFGRFNRALNDNKSALLKEVNSNNPMDYFYINGYFKSDLSGEIILNPTVTMIKVPCEFKSFIYLESSSNMFESISAGFRIVFAMKDGTLSQDDLSVYAQYAGTTRYTMPIVSPPNAEYVYIILNTANFGDVKIFINNLYCLPKKALNYPTGIIPINETTALKSKYYFRLSDIGSIGGDFYCLWFFMSAGDKLIDIPSYSGLSAKGNVLVSGDTRVIGISNLVTEYTATEECIVCIFTLDATPTTAKLVKKNCIKIKTADILDYEPIDPINYYKNLSGVAFGTSLTYRAQTTGGYLQYLPTLSGISFDNQGLGSSTILPSASTSQMLPVITGYSGYSGKRVCILEGFVNDFYYNGASLGTWKDTGQTTVCGCVRYAIDYILTQNPNLTIFLVMDHFGKGITAANALNDAGQTQFEFYQEIEKVALSMGVRVIREYELSEISQLTPQYLLDNIHLNDLGAKQSANAIWGEMKKTFPNEVLV